MSIIAVSCVLFPLVDTASGLSLVADAFLVVEPFPSSSPLSFSSLLFFPIFFVLCRSLHHRRLDACCRGYAVMHGVLTMYDPQVAISWDAISLDSTSPWF